eukprot:scaffold2033_cov164-Amphora_coffeaeformis.AAC.17
MANKDKPAGAIPAQDKATDEERTTVVTPTNAAAAAANEALLGAAVAKSFPITKRKSQIFVGEVTEVRAPDEGDDDPEDDTVYYRIVYEDGDEEDMDEQEVIEAMALYRQEQARKEEASLTQASSSRKRAAPALKDGRKDKETEEGGGRSRRRRVVSYKEDDSDDDEDDDDDEEKVQVAKPKKGRGVSKGAGKKRAAAKGGDEDDDFDMASVPSDDDDDAMIVDSEEDDDDDILEDSDDAKPKGKRKAASNKKPSTGKRATSKAAATSERHDGYDDEYWTKMEKDRKAFKPNNNPQKWPKDGDYVEPVGVDPTHGIVEGIIGEQVRKIGGLLQAVEWEVAASTDKPQRLGELTFPIKLQTACSGTDAPSIALGLVKETLEKMSGKSKSPLFEFQHVMSCEIEPFKQAYIGRNFPGVPLYPDITKLTASEKVLDVYGRPQAILDGNFFIAGTSCKDFSMLKTSYRLDIEDKGTSGETFLAAVEFLQTYQPQVAIFENVDGAPWDKMQEYITGRIFLGNRNDTKAIKDAKKKADADKELTFSVNEDGRYVAESIPRQVGIRAGSIVKGIVRDGEDASNVEPLISKDKTNRIINLGELAKKHKISLEVDTLVMEYKVNYCTHLCKLDTKDYGLPQTRNRKYLYIWRSDNPEDDLGEYFQEIIDHLKTPLLHSMDAFLLKDNHDRIRCFREALRSGPGLLVHRDRAKELDFWDWNLSRVKDLTLHKVFREQIGLEEKSRWLTGWDTRGRKCIAPGLWPELVDCWNMRRLDMVDCFAGAAIRDAISRDPLHHSFTWDLSQNVTRAPFRSATVGVSGCVTPGGEIIMPHKGRTLMGYEKLLLQEDCTIRRGGLWCAIGLADGGLPTKGGCGVPVWGALLAQARTRNISAIGLAEGDTGTPVAA